LSNPFFNREKSYQVKSAEFWPDWLIQLPLFVQGALLGLWRGGLTWFTRVNPGMAYGGMLAYSKAEILEGFAVQNRPKELRFTLPLALNNLLVLTNESGMDWPLVLKPDQGERGRNVFKVETANELAQILEQLPSGVYLLQAFIQLPYEFGVFVAKNTQTELVEVISLTWKVPLGVLGDGQSSVAQLLAQHPRAQRYRALYAKWPATLLAKIPAKSSWETLHFSGNHCKGAAFVDASMFIDVALSQVFDGLLGPLTDFRFGRLDVMVPSPEALWDREQIVVIEINGANAEPAHIYDATVSTWRMFSEMLYFQRVMWRQSLHMQKKGIVAPKVRDFWPVWRAYKAQMKAASLY